MSVEWTPETLKVVAQALYGTTWQSGLAADLQDFTRSKFRSIRVRQWFLEKNRRPIPGWVQDNLDEVFLNALRRYDDARDVAATEIAKRLGFYP